MRVGRLGLLGGLRPLGGLGLILVPEEVLVLGFLLLGRLGAEDGLQGVGVVAGVPHLGGNGQGGGREVLHLLQVKSQTASDGCQLLHVLLVTAGVAGDEVGDDLLVEVLLTADAVEDALELLELAEWWFAHVMEHPVAGMFGSHLQTSADMAGDELSGVFPGCSVGSLVLALVQQQVVAHTTADEALLNAGKGIDGMVDIEQLGVVGIEVGAYLRMDTAGALALLAGIEVATVHTVHVGRRTSEIAEIAFEVRHLDNLLHLF